MPLEKRLMFDASLPAIAGQVLWLDANDATTILDAEGDNAASGPAFSGQAATWRDKSTSGFHVSALAGERPVYTVNALNGHSVLTFDGINDKMTRATASIPGDDFTMFVVFNKTQTANRDAVFEFGSGTARNALFVNDASASTRMNYYINNSFINYTSTYTAGTYTMASVTHDGTSVNLGRNGTTEVTTTGGNRIATNGLYVGDDSSTGDHLQGNIAEILIYDRDLSAAERHDIENYLGNKWGLAIANNSPTVSANTGVTIDQGDSAVITAAMLSSSDTDNTNALLRYTITNTVDYGTLTNTNTGLALGLGDSFTQGDIAAGYITYAHDNTLNFSESFSFTVSDGYATTAAASFAITLTPTNNAPVVDANTGATVNEGGIVTIDNAHLSSSDADGLPNASGWYDGNWMYRQRITIDSTMVDADLTDFSILLTQANMLGSFWGDVKGDGSDIVITAADGTTKLSRELVSIDTSLQSMELYAKLPFVADATDTIFYIYYGNAAGAEINDTAAWNASYAAVWHLDSTGGTVAESTANNLAGILQGAATQGAAGITGYALSVAGGSAVISNSTPLEVMAGDTFTYETWYRGTGSNAAIISMMNQSEAYQGYDIYIDSGRAAMHLINAWSGDALKMVSNVVINDDAWHHIVVTYDGTSGPGGVKIYVDGVDTALSASNNNLVSNDTTPNAPFRIGARSDGAGGVNPVQGITGIIDEVRFYNGILSAEQIGAQYENTRNTATFYMTGARETYAGSVEYTVTTLPTQGTLRINGTALGVGDTFTQTDIDSGLLTYAHNGSETVSDSFQFTISDGIDTTAAQAFSLTVTPVNDAPVIGTNTGATVVEGASVVITTAMLNEADPDDFGADLTYTASNYVRGHITVNGVTQNTFTQADIDNGLVSFVHDGDEGPTASFDIALADGGEDGAAAATGTFTLNVTPVNDAPEIQGWTLVSYEDFESGATGWNINTTEPGNIYTTRHLGRFSNDGPGQNVFKTYTLSGDQAYTVIEFDFYRFDSWDTEAFRIYIDDVLIFNQNFTTAIVAIPDGASGNVSWSVTETTTTPTNFIYGQWNDQKMRFTLTIQNAAESDIKIGFGSGTQQGIADESYGIDNVRVYEANDSGVPGPFTIAENSGNGQTVGRITATDAENDTITYSIIGGTGMGAFSINATTGLVTVANMALLNYEVTPTFTLQIRATDNGSPNLFDTETITIHLIDVPENAAPTVNVLGPLTVAENSANNTVIGTATGSDPDGHSITWSITGGNTDNIFAIHSTTGAIRIVNNAALNYEWDNQYTLTITATDNGFGNLTANRNVVINITNINEAPTYDTHQMLMALNPYLRYDSVSGNYYQYVGTTANYATASANAAAQTLHGVSGHLVTITSLAENNYVRALGGGSIWLGASDSVIEGDWVWGDGGAEGGQMFWQGTSTGSAQNGLYARWSAGEPSNASNADYAIMLASGMWDDVVGTGAYAYVIEWEGAAVQAAAAALQNGPYAVNENVTAGTVVGSAEAADPDAGDTITYSVTGGTGAGVFTVNATTGVITVTASNTLNYESVTSYTLDIRAQDAGGLFATRTITININDLNETPVINAMTPVTIAENTADNTLIATASASDPDGHTLTYSITGGNGDGIFSINAATGQVRVTNMANMSFEYDNQHVLTIRATDNGTGNLFAQTTLTVNITNVNEAPTFDAIQALLLSDPLLRYNSATGNFYKYIGTTATYAIASADAASRTLNGVGGHIATITSLAENAYVRSMGSGTLWLAGRDNIIEGDWYWDGGGAENGIMFWQGTGAGSVQNGLFARWAGGEPNNSSNEDFLTMRTDGFWNDIGSGNHAYVVEWEGATVLGSLTALHNGPYTIDENSAAGTVLGHAQAFDVDAGDTITYSITGGTGASLFYINGTTGEIRVANGALLNYETVNSYTLDLRIQDAAGLFDTRTVNITINDINDLPVNLEISGQSVTENTAIGTLIGTLSAFDEDPADILTYTLLNDAGGRFRLVGDRIETRADIDYELHQSHVITVRVDDGSGGIMDRNFTINVINEADDAVIPTSSDNFNSNTQNFSFEVREEKEQRELLSAALQDEGALSGAYYGMGEFMQILRENTVMQIRQILLSGNSGGDIHTQLPSFITELYRIDAPEENDNTPPEPPQGRYTNLREVLAQLEQYAADEQTENDDTEDGAGRNLPRTALDHQFEDVMTYHEKRRAALREALMA